MAYAQKLSKPKTRVIADEYVYYKENRAVLKRGKDYILRNTWTGEEKIISKDEAIRFKQEWKSNKGEWF